MSFIRIPADERDSYIQVLQFKTITKSWCALGANRLDKRIFRVIVKISLSVCHDQGHGLCTPPSRITESESDQASGNPTQQLETRNLEAFRTKKVF